jgi:hypothetical protein
MRAVHLNARRHFSHLCVEREVEEESDCMCVRVK